MMIKTIASVCWFCLDLVVCLLYFPVKRDLKLSCFFVPIIIFYFTLVVFSVMNEISNVKQTEEYTEAMPLRHFVEAKKRNFVRQKCK